MPTGYSVPSGSVLGKRWQRSLPDLRTWSNISEFSVVQDQKIFLQCRDVFRGVEELPSQTVQGQDPSRYTL